MFMVHMPKLLKLTKMDTNKSYSYQDQSTLDYTKKLEDISKIEDKLEDKLEDVSEYNPDPQPRKFNIDEKQYAQQTHMQNEMIFNKKQCIQRQNDAKDMKLNALKHEISKVEQRTDNIENEMNQHAQTINQIQENKHLHDQKQAKDNLKIQFEQIEKQLDQAIDEDEPQDEPESMTCSQINQMIDNGYQQNDMLFEEMERIQHQHQSFDTKKDPTQAASKKIQQNSKPIKSKPMKLNSLKPTKYPTRMGHF